MVPFIALHLDRRSRVPLQRQLYDEIRTAILSGRLEPGARVPATRVLASDTGSGVAQVAAQTSTSTPTLGVQVPDAGDVGILADGGCVFGALPESITCAPVSLWLPDA